MSTVVADTVSKFYGPVAALDGVSLTFADGELFGLLGPSGSGKTTLLRMVAGFIAPDTGSISFDGERVDQVPVQKRGIGMVFQNYALFPHLTVAENIGFGLSVRGAPAGEIAKEVAAMLDLVQLEGYGDRTPRQLSGGQQQRVALARALITRPKVLLLDEPLGALDRRLRQEMQVELRQIQRRIGITTIFVTHDQEEALTLSDRIAIIDKGKLVQVGAPKVIYERPATIFAAQFLGDANVLSGTATPEGLRLADGTAIRVGAVGGASGHAGTSRTAIVRPEKLLVSPAATPADPARNHLAGQVTQAIFSGASVTYYIRVPTMPEPILAFVQNRTAEVFAIGTEVAMTWRGEDTVAVQV